MSVNEILRELPRLSPEDRNLLRDELDEHFIDDIEETPEMLAAIDEGIRSSREEGTITLEELREEMKTWPKEWAADNIINLLHKLPSAELKLIKQRLDASCLSEFDATPEMLDAIEEGRRSLREEGGIPIEEAIKEVATWNTKSS
jgi:uncharacterized protein (UPF0262 family)